MSASDETLYAFRRNLVVAASAGTGKTHSLVGVVVHLLLGASELGNHEPPRRGSLRDPVDPARLVATTFSRKAAAEIRARIVEELERLALGDPGRYGASLDAACVRCKGAPLSPEERARRARRALERFPLARVGTLHSFAASLIQANALDVGLVPGFELASEDEDRRRLEESVAWALEACFEREPDAAREIADVAGGVDRAVVLLADTLRRLEEDGSSPADLAIADGDAAEIDRAMQRLLELARELSSEDRLGPAAADVLAAHAAADEARLEEAMAALFGVSRAGTKSAAAERLFEMREGLPGTTNAERGRRFAQLWAARDRIVHASARVRRVLAEADAERRRRMLAAGTPGFGDVLRIARELLRERPDVATSIGASLDVLLVDEFQDTSRVQRDLVALLWARPDARVAGEVPSLGAVRASGLFVVGDRKQSIYGFRGADVGVFAELCVALAGEPARLALGIPAGVAWEPETPSADFVSLRENRRSAPGLLAFSNAMSARMLRPSGPPPVLYEIDYVAETEDLLAPPERASETPEPCTLWLRPAPRDKPLRRIEEAWILAERMRRLVATGEGLPSGAAMHGPIRWRDLAVLALTNEMLDAAAFALAEHGIPYVVEGRGFFASREVRDLAAMLALVLDPNDRRALLEVLRGPWAGVSDRTLVGLTDPGQGLAAPGDGWEHGERRRLVEEGDVEHLRRLREVVLELHHAHDRLGPARVLREAVAALALEDTLAALPRGAQRVANVRKLLALAERDADCPTFARRLADAMARDAPEAEAATFSESDDAVRLLTVHASKGLSFPIVFVPQMGAAAAWRGTGPFALEIGDARGPTRLAVRVVASDGALLDPPSFARARAADRRRTEAERRRLLYVAMTRASRAMFLVGDRPPARSETAASSPVGAFALADIAATEDRARAACLLVEEVEPARPAERLATSPAPATAPAVQGPEIRPSWRTLPIAPTLLADFHHCPRRFELLHVLGLPESPRGAALAPKEAASADVDARREGTLAHAVLERIDVACFGRPGAREEISRLLENEGLAAAHPRHEVVLERVLGFIEGAYAARIARARARVLREHPFVMEVPDDAGRVVSLRGSVDLVVLWPDGAVDVVDYKRARGPSPAPYAFQLGVYALAVRDFVRDDKALRAGIVFLGGARAEPAWLADLDVDAQRREIAALGELVMEARWSGRFPRVELERCRAIRCGYVRSCHP